MKKTIEEITQDLKDIKYYYAHEQILQKAIPSESV